MVFIEIRSDVISKKLKISGFKKNLNQEINMLKIKKTIYLFGILSCYVNLQGMSHNKSSKKEIARVAWESAYQGNYKQALKGLKKAVSMGSWQQHFVLQNNIKKGDY